MIRELSAWVRPEGVPKNWTEAFYKAYVDAELASRDANKVTDYVVNKGKEDRSLWHVIDNAKRLHLKAQKLHEALMKKAPDPKTKEFHRKRALYHHGYVTAHPDPL